MSYLDGLVPTEQAVRERLGQLAAEARLLRKLRKLAWENDYSMTPRREAARQAAGDRQQHQQQNAADGRAVTHG